MSDVADRIAADGRTRLSAIQRARGAFETYVRIHDISETVRSLTPRQDDDMRAARAVYNEEARSLAIPEIDGSWSAESMTQAVDLLYAAEKRAQKYIDYPADEARRGRLAEQVRSSIGDQGNDDSGWPRDHRRAAADPIRDMITSREQRHDFAYPDHDVVRMFEPANPDDEQSEVRAISDFANSAALYTSDFSTQVAVFARTLSPWLGLATIVNADNGRPLVIPDLTSDSTTYTPGEGTAISASDPTLGSVTITPISYKNLTYISHEALEDSEYNITQYVARSQARSLGLAFGSAGTTAILAAINNGGTATGIGGAGTGTATFVGYEDLLDLKFGRQAPYRANGSWVMSNGMIKKTAKYRDGQGAYLWVSPSSAGPEALLGNGLYEDPYLVSPGSGTKSVIYGDVLAGVTIKATAIRVAVSSDFLFDKDQIAVKTVQRLALAVPDATALAYLVSAST